MKAIFYAGSLGLPLTGASVLLLFSSSFFAIFIHHSSFIHIILNLASGALWRQSESMDGMGMGHTPSAAMTTVASTAQFASICVLLTFHLHFQSSRLVLLHGAAQDML